MTIIDVARPAVSLGNSPGWLLTFHRLSDGKVKDQADLTLSCEDYDATIDATLPPGLAGGSYTVVLHGCTDDHHRQLALRPGAKDQPSVVRLHLYWRDANESVLAYLANLAGLSSLVGGVTGPIETAGGLDSVRVAQLRLTKVARRVGSRQYETVLSMTEHAWVALGEPHEKSIVATTMQEAVDAVSERAKVDIELHQGTALPPLAPDRQGVDHRTFRKGVAGRDVLRELAAALGHGRQTFGRSMLLVRDGTVHLGARPVPVSGRPHELTPPTGLLAVSQESPLEVGGGQERLQFAVTLRGRGDIRPGDVVRFDPPDQDDSTTLLATGAAIAGGVTGITGSVLSAGTGSERRAYVSGVKHQIAPRTGFVTTLAVVVLEHGDEQWPGADKAARRRRADRTTALATPDDAMAVADGVRGVVGRALDDLALPDVAEVRGCHSKGAEEPPGQTAKLWRGLAGDDGKPHAARRLDIDRDDPEEVDGVPYVTPFAWGSCGLVVPRYPGTRVLLAHRNGYPDDPIDIGAMWVSGQGPESEPGDWWLILPVAVAETDRANAGGEGAVATTATSATNDLVDADGDRRIEVGKLTVRVGPDGLASPGTRPEPTSDNRLVSIEHADGTTRIVIDEDGNIVLEAKGSVTVKGTGGGITLDAGSKDVIVKCGQMKVE